MYRKWHAATKVYKPTSANECKSESKNPNTSYIDYVMSVKSEIENWI